MREKTLAPQEKKPIHLHAQGAHNDVDMKCGEKRRVKLLCAVHAHVNNYRSHRNFCGVIIFIKFTWALQFQFKTRATLNNTLCNKI